MAQRYLFFNSITGDRRRYQAQDFAEYFGSILSTGLLHTDTEEPGLVVSVEQGTLNTVVSDGKAIMRGHLYENTTPVTLEHRIPEPDADRIDRVVLRLDSRQSERNILLYIIEGDASNPPELQRDNSIYEISLAQIRVRANTSSIDPQDVIDERLDEELCGLVRLMFPFPSEQFVIHEDFEEFKTETETNLSNKADLVNGQVPVSQLENVPESQVTGTYTGTGSRRLIVLGFEPSAVLAIRNNGIFGGLAIESIAGFATRGNPSRWDGINEIEINVDGFHVDGRVNDTGNNNPYKYIAWR